MGILKKKLGRVKLFLEKVPCREESMTPYEMMLSETQERMLIFDDESHFCDQNIGVKEVLTIF